VAREAGKTGGFLSTGRRKNRSAARLMSSADFPAPVETARPEDRKKEKAPLFPA